MLPWGFLGVGMGWGVEKGRRNSEAVQGGDFCGHGLTLCNVYMCHKWVFGVQSMSRGCQVFISSCYCCAFVAQEFWPHTEANPSCSKLEAFEHGWAVPWGLILDSLGAGEAFLHCLSSLVLWSLKFCTWTNTVFLPGGQKNPPFSCAEECATWGVWFPFPALFWCHCVVSKMLDSGCCQEGAWVSPAFD